VIRLKIWLAIRALTREQAAQALEAFTDESFVALAPWDTCPLARAYGEPGALHRRLKREAGSEDGFLWRAARALGIRRLYATAIVAAYDDFHSPAHHFLKAQFQKRAKARLFPVEIFDEDRHSAVRTE
jgi:hypothetical protein